MPRLNLRRDERGSALVSVVGIVLVTIVIGMTISAVTVSALDRTSNTRATVTADFAAEAGVAVAQGDLEAGRCATHGPIYESATTNGAPYYRAVVLKSTATGPQLGCPSDQQSARIVSTGYATEAGYLAENGVKRTVEAAFNLPPVPLVPSGPAVFADSSQGMGGSGKLVAENGLEPSVYVREGDVTCAGASSGTATWVVKDGDFYGGGSCIINGSVWVSGRAEVTGGALIGGDLVASQVTLASATVNGRLFSRGYANLSQGKVGKTAAIHGNLDYKGTEVGRLVNGVPVDGTVWVSGNAHLDWSVNIRGRLYAASVNGPAAGTGAGGQTIGTPVGTPAVPVAPTVGEWVDLPYNPDLWTGFTVVTLTGNCGINELRGAVTTLAGRPGLIDARACLGGVTIGGTDILTIDNDTAIYARSFNLDGSGGFRSTDGDNLWLINEDATASTPRTPHCDSQSFTAGGGFTFTGVIMMIYSPCRVNIESGLTLRGQIFAGEVDIAGNATLIYAKSGLPGYNLDTGQPVTGTGPRTVATYTNTSDSAERWIP